MSEDISQKAALLRAALVTGLAQHWIAAGINPGDTAQDMQEFVESALWEPDATESKCADMVNAFIAKVKAGCTDKNPIVLVAPFADVFVASGKLSAYVTVTIGFVIARPPRGG